MPALVPLMLWLAKPSLVPALSQLLHEDFSSELAPQNDNLCYTLLMANLGADGIMLRFCRDLILDQKLAWNSSVHQECGLKTCFCLNDCSGRHCAAGGGHSEIVGVASTRRFNQTDTLANSS